MTPDRARLAWIATIMDAIGDSDFHEIATFVHQKRCGCGKGPTQADYGRAVCIAIDNARQPQTQKPTP